MNDSALSSVRGISFPSIPRSHSGILGPLLGAGHSWTGVIRLPRPYRTCVNMTM
ncbi:hypothetical protein J6590_036134 [Homalodisca vitripennis]|nr:hypothetical protein J6590_036134 [Homalodisca vitripennis]